MGRRLAQGTLVYTRMMHSKGTCQWHLQSRLVLTWVWTALTPNVAGGLDTTAMRRLAPVLGLANPSQRLLQKPLIAEHLSIAPQWLSLTTVVKRNCMSWSSSRLPRALMRVSLPVTNGLSSVT